MNENNSAKRFIFYICVAALLGIIVFVFFKERHKQRDYLNKVQEAARQETELVLAVETEVDTDTETAFGTEPSAETKAAPAIKDESKTEPETENLSETVFPEGTETEEAVTEAASEAVTEEDWLEEAETESESEDNNPYRPVMKLRRSQVTIHVGDTFDPLLYVESIDDDRDNVWALWRDIQIEGNYDTKVPGEYTLEYYVTDSDGYRCVPRRLRLMVKR